MGKDESGENSSLSHNFLPLLLGRLAQHGIPSHPSPMITAQHIYWTTTNSGARLQAAETVRPVGFSAALVVNVAGG